MRHALGAGRAAAAPARPERHHHPDLWHRFYGEAGKGPVFVGEVSQVNDDLADNYFFEAVGRFAAIEEDEPNALSLVERASGVIAGKFGVAR